MPDDDTVDLSDPERGFDPAADTGVWLNAEVPGVDLDPTPLPRFVEIPSAPWLTRVPASEAGLHAEVVRELDEAMRDDGGEWRPSDGWPVVLLTLYVALAVAVGFAVVSVALLLFGRTGGVLGGGSMNG